MYPMRVRRIMESVPPAHIADKLARPSGDRVIFLLVTGLRISIDREGLSAFCRRWKISELAFFGSVLRDDFGPDSDVDVLVAFSPNAEWSLFDLVRMEEDLGALVGRKVDIVTRRSIESSENWIRRRAILGSAQVVYAA